MFQTLDQTTDINGQQLYRLSKLYPLPPFVKKASSDDIYGTDSIQNHQFADVTHRQFPCHTAASTYISTLFFMDKKAEIDSELAKIVESRIDDFAFFHGISERINDLKTKVASSSKINDLVDTDDFALILTKEETRSGKEERYYPLRNALEVKKAAEYLQEYRDALPLEYRQKMAEKILEKANKYGAGLGDLDTFLHKQAGHGSAASYDVASLLFDRARLLKKAGKLDYAVKLGEIAKTVANEPVRIQDQDRLVKLACIVDDIDRETGLTRLLDDLPKPEDTFFNITEKAASKLITSHFTTTSGNIYKLADVDKLKLTDIRDTMGTDFADAISTGGLFVSPEKISEIVPTLPRGDAELFDNLLNTVGVKPVAKEAAHISNSFSKEELAALAKLHTVTR